VHKLITVKVFLLIIKKGFARLLRHRRLLRVRSVLYWCTIYDMAM